MKNRKPASARQSKQLTVDEFKARHEKEFSESVEFENVKQLSALFPRGRVPTSWLFNPSPEREAWLTTMTSTPEYRLMKELKRFWLVRLLKAAKRENCPQAYRELLEDLLIRLGVEAPEGVLVAPPGIAGRPRKQSTEEIYRIYIENGRPKGAHLAYVVYRSDYIRADSKSRRKMQQQCFASVKRYEAQQATKSRRQ